MQLNPLAKFKVKDLITDMKRETNIEMWIINKLDTASK